MRPALLFLFVSVLSSGSATAEVDPAATSAVLTTVRINAPVLAGGAPLPAGTYEIRLTGQRPSPPAGQPQDAEEWVEFVADGKVVARETAEIIDDDDLPAEGASSQTVQQGTRVEMLKGGEFLRISVKRDRQRYLIYLPTRK
jgi:hypothetical protein